MSLKENDTFYETAHEALEELQEPVLMTERDLKIYLGMLDRVALKPSWGDNRAWIIKELNKMALEAIIRFYSQFGKAAA